MVNGFLTNNFQRRFKRFINRRLLRIAVGEPRRALNIITHEIGNSGVIAAETLLRRRAVHVARFTASNGGDTLLPTVLRDLFQQKIGGISWDPLNAHDSVGSSELRRMERANFVVVGGGGLFLKDTNPNNVSGWQWPIASDQLRELKVPLVVFAVGYNRFRDQEDFDSCFVENVRTLVDRCTFFGLRNHGSIRSIRNYLPNKLQDKVVFQPCMTVCLREIYPELFHGERVSGGRKVVALNCAFDRPEKRFGNRSNEVLRGIAKVAAQLSKNADICYYSHAEKDDRMLSYLSEESVPFRYVRLYDEPPMTVLESYRDIDLAIGMRGHAQMIPFGCGVPILSLISHDKIRWFLEDAKMADFGVELEDQCFVDKASELAERLLFDPEFREAHLARLALARQGFWEVTCHNMSVIKNRVL